MTSITDITKFFYELLNVSSLTDLLSGGVYRNQRPKNLTSSDVVIIPRFISGTGAKNVSNGQLQIVVILPKIAGVPDLKSQLAIENAIIDIFANSINKQESNNFYFELLQTTEHDNYDGQILFSSLYLTLQIHKP